mgnify:FL=1
MWIQFGLFLYNFKIAWKIEQEENDMDRKNAWTTYSKEELDRLEQVNTEYKNCLDAGKTERECVALAVEKAKAEGYKDCLLYTSDAADD